MWESQTDMSQVENFRTDFVLTDALKTKIVKERYQKKSVIYK